MSVGEAGRGSHSGGGLERGMRSHGMVGGPLKREGELGAQKWKT